MLGATTDVTKMNAINTAQSVDAVKTALQSAMSAVTIPSKT
jgi:hypothetical protein